MVEPSKSTIHEVSRQPHLAPLSILRTETVLSRFPIHNLTQGSCQLDTFFVLEGLEL